MRDLTKRQQDILDWIVAFRRKHGMPPTVREIGRDFDISSAGVHGHLKAIERKGYLKRGELGARSLELVDAPPEDQPESGRIPVVGRIVAGEPLLAVENAEGAIRVDESMLHPPNAEFFALHVRGDSMIEAGILDGDYAVVRRQNTARDGEIVVALIDDEATLKRFFREGRRVRLAPANRRMKPIYTSDAVIQGIVTGIVRTMART